MTLTKKQKNVLDFIKFSIERNGYAPSLQEIQKKFRFASVSTAHHHVKKLEREGYLKKGGKRARAIEVSKFVRIPLLGVIAAGQPIEAIENRETISVPSSKVPHTVNLFALTVQGDSMVEENIEDGDTILVKQQQTAENGETVIALIYGDHATVKKFYKEKGRVRLQPANSSIRPIFVKDKDLTIQGVVHDVIKSAGSSSSQQFEHTRPTLLFGTHKTLMKPHFISNTGRNRCEFYLGDSLSIIPALDQKYRIVYLDPPFNSNREYTYSAVGGDFGFADKWAKGEYEKWIDAMLAACKSKMLKDGTLFFHISAELSLIPHLILRKHFNKVEPIFWKKAHGKNTVKNKLGSVIDIVFKASNNGSLFNLLHVPLDTYYFENSYKNKDAVGYYALGSLKHDKTRRGHMYRYERNGIIYEAPYGWKISRARLNELLEQDRIHFARPKPGTNNGMLYKKLYKHETKGKPLSNLWDDIAYITRTTKDGRLYPTQKPMELLKRIVALSSNEDDWVLDPVAGSATTGVAALALGRNVTLIDVSKDAARIAKSRICR